jgi:UPF0755 protein
MSFGKKIISKLIVLGILAAIAFGAYWAYQNLYKPNVNTGGKNQKFIYIPKGEDYPLLLEILYNEGVIENHTSFEFMAKRMELDKNVHSGKFKITNGMNNRQIILMLKNNRQEKIKLTFNSQIHNKEELIEYLDNKLELSYDDVEEYLSDDQLLEKEYGMDPDNMMALILNNVYEVSWAITTDDLFLEIKEYFDSVFNKNRKEKASKTGYSIPEIVTIASIVQSESGIYSEQQKIAGVYINRLKKGMLLQADPTLKFANKNYEVQRVTNADKEIDSPYNTYKYKGLPPGPICLVTTQAIDAVLNYTKHNFVFFCARPDFSGYSDFASTYEQHQRNAGAYQRALDKKGIMR